MRMVAYLKEVTRMIKSMVQGLVLLAVVKLLKEHGSMESKKVMVNLSIIMAM